MRWLLLFSLLLIGEQSASPQISGRQIESDVSIALTHAFGITDFNGSLRAGKFLDGRQQVELRLGFGKVNRAGHLDFSAHYLFHPQLFAPTIRPYLLIGAGGQAAFIGSFHYLRPTLAAAVGGKFFHARRFATRLEVLVQRIFATSFSFTQIDFLVGFSVFFGSTGRVGDGK